MMMNFRLERYT